MSENSEPYELVNGSSEPESSAAAADTASAADPDDQLPDPKDTDVQPFDAERVGSVHIEASNAMQEERVLYAFNDADSRTPQLNQDMGSDSKLRDSEVDRTITMREPLNELKNGDGNGNDERKADTPRSQQNLEQQIEQNIAVVELMNSVTAIDEERRSRQRHLTNAAQRYATTVERNPEDYDALYRWALLLQESADNVSSESSSQSKDALLEEACKKYKEATRLCPTLGEAYYDWAVAISARARIRGRTNEAEEFWKQSTKYYERAVQLNWNNGQALNNWGLALQELSAIVPAREKQTIVRTAISKFRAAIQLQFDFHGAIYNVGTVLYGLADDILRTGGHDKVSRDELYKLSALYIAVAHALKPNYSLYYSALKLTRSMLPLPYLKVGYLTAPPVGNPVAPHSDWKRSQFLLNHEGLQQYNRVERSRLSPNLSLKSGDSPISKPIIRVDVPDIVSVSACADLTLPPGAGLCIDTIHGPVFLIADCWESLGGWLDAVRLVYTIFAKGKNDVLAGILIA